MVKSCLTCRVHQKMNDGVIPKWYKDIGNDSQLMGNPARVIRNK